LVDVDYNEGKGVGDEGGKVKGKRKKRRDDDGKGK
jgi:hypothetical protein